MRALLSRFDLRTSAHDYGLATLGACLLTVNMTVLAPAKIAPGGVSGLAIIVNASTGWSIGLTMLVLNVPLVILGFWSLGRFRFLWRTLYAVLLYNLGVVLLAHWRLAPGVTDDLLLASLFGGVLGGLGSGLVFRGGGTTAGTGILGRVLQMRTGVPVSQIYLMTDGVVIVIAGLVFGWERGLYALISVFVWGLATDFVLEGPSVVRTAFIVTDTPQAVANAILRELHIGVTAWSAEGMFTKSGHSVLFCTVSRPGERALRKVVTDADPEAFYVVGHGHQARGGVYGVARRNGRKSPQRKG